MAEITCPYAKRTGQNGLFYCMKPTDAAPKKAAKGKKKAEEKTEEQAATAPVELRKGKTEPVTCGHQRYCPAKRKCVLTEQAAICPKRKD